RNIMKYKRIIILTILVLTILSFFSFVYAQVWVIEYSGDITPVASKVSSKIRETYLKDYYSNDISPTPQYDDINMKKSAGTFKILDKQGNIIGVINKTSLSISKKVGFSSVDDVMTAATINNIGKDPYAPPITIGSSVEDVIRAMGTPESIQISFKSFKYRNSTVYFDDDWKVQSWDNRYGNLKVSLENESDDILDIGEYLIDGILKITNDNLNKKSAILPIDIAVEKIIKEFHELLENQ
ncbi:unnamed protein product, partial [marine sediment metagenome]